MARRTAREAERGAAAARDAEQDAIRDAAEVSEPSDNAAAMPFGVVEEEPHAERAGKSVPISDPAAKETKHGKNNS